MNYQSTYSFSAAAAATGVWDFDATLLPHPVDFMNVRRWDTVTPHGGVPYEVCFENTQLIGASPYLKYAAFKELAQRWRLAYMSVTIYQDGPDLANQGTVVVAQMPVKPLITYMIIQAAGTAAGFPRLAAYQTSDLPDYATSQGMPNAYFNRSREGCYVPLKLTNSCQDWISESDDVCPLALGTAYSPVFGNIPLPAVANTTWPNRGTAAAFSTGLAGGGAGGVTSAMMNDAFAHISFRNVAVTTSFSFFVRCGIEMQVQPGSTLAPQMKLSPPYDQQALATYFAISRELKDAYPADWNDLGKIWDEFSRIASVVLPALKSFGPWGAAIGNVGQTMLGVGDTIRSNRKKTKKIKAQNQRIRAGLQPPLPPKIGRDRPPAAATERMVQEIQQERAVVPMRRRRRAAVNARPVNA